MLCAVDWCSPPHSLAHCRCVLQTASVVHLQHFVSPGVKLMGDMGVSHQYHTVTRILNDRSWCVLDNPIPKLKQTQVAAEGLLCRREPHSHT